LRKRGETNEVTLIAILCVCAAFAFHNFVGFYAFF